ncbi:unnamed protein product, partial [Rotaria sordida]
VEKHSPNVYELDTTNLSLWYENVEQRAEAIIDAFLKDEKIPFDALPKTPIDEPVYEQNTCLACQRVFHMKSQWLDHLKSKQHKRVLRTTDRAAYRQKLNNAIPSLLNTLDLLEMKKISEIEKKNDEFEIDNEMIETLENNN